MVGIGKDRGFREDQRAAVVMKWQKFEQEQAAERKRIAESAQGDRGKEGGRGKVKPLMSKSTGGVSTGGTQRDALAKRAERRRLKGRRPCTKPPLFVQPHSEDTA